MISKVLTMQKNKELFLGITWSVASVTLPEMIMMANNAWFNVTWHATDRAKQFVLSRFERELDKFLKKSPSLNCLELINFQNKLQKLWKRSITKNVDLSIIFNELDELKRILNAELTINPILQILFWIHSSYENWVDFEWVFGKWKWKVKHINIAQKSDLVLVAPTTANTLAKIVAWITDNFLLEVIRAIWPWKKVYLALAMNTDMLRDPFVKRNIRLVKEEWEGKYILIPTIIKQLHCWAVWDWAMEEVPQIMHIIKDGN